MSRVLSSNPSELLQPMLGVGLVERDFLPQPIVVVGWRQMKPTLFLPLLPAFTASAFEFTGKVVWG